MSSEMILRSFTEAAPVAIAMFDLEMRSCSSQSRPSARRFAPLGFGLSCGRQSCLQAVFQTAVFDTRQISRGFGTASGLQTKPKKVGLKRSAGWYLPTSSA